MLAACSRLPPAFCPPARPPACRPPARPARESMCVGMVMIEVLIRPSPRPAVFCRRRSCLPCRYAAFRCLPLPLVRLSFALSTRLREVRRQRKRSAIASFLRRSLPARSFSCLSQCC